MAAASPDTRALKDSAAGYLQRSQFDKAAQALEALVRAEPKEMQHRLRLGDCFRKLKQPQRAIRQFDTVARTYAAEDQYIKAIAALKLILEIEPANGEAREQLSQLNLRRRSGVAPLRAAPAPAPATGPLELQEEPLPLSSTTQAQIPDYGKELVFDDAADKFVTGKRSKDVIVPPAPAAFVDVGSLADASEEPLRLPTDAIVGPAQPLPPQRPVIDPLPPGPDTEPLFPHEGTAQDEDEPMPRSIADLLRPDAEEEPELNARPDDAPTPTPTDRITLKVDAAVDAIAPPQGARRTLPPRVPLFEDLPQDALVELVNRLSHLRFRTGDQILREGERGRSFFVIVEGGVRIWKALPDGARLDLATLGEGAFFGEMALLAGAPRTANVSAERDTELLEVTDSVLRDLTKKHPQVAQSLRNFYRRRLLDNVMAISPLFKDFDPSERPQLVERFRLRQAAPGEIVIKEATPSDGLYVILHGTVDVAAKGVALAKLKEGDIFGEMSLLTREPASATVTSPGNAILLRLARAQFQELIVTHPQVLVLVSELTEQRAAATREALDRHSISSFV